MTSVFAKQSFLVSKPLLLVLCSFLTSSLVMELGCASSGRTISSTPPVISAGPANQSVRVGGTVTFSVVASGTAPLSYQWSKNKIAITGATSPTYSTPAAVAVDAGAAFSVTVTNATGSASSTPATLTVMPRAPAAGDWRFQGIDLPFTPATTLATNLTPPWDWSYPDSIGSPLTTGAAPGICVPGIAYDCSWGYIVSAAPTGVTGISSYYALDALSNLDADLNGLATPNIVITSLDIERDNQIFGDSWLQTSGQGGFVLQQQLVDPTQVQAVASLLGAQGQVITAVSFKGGQVSVLSYLWQSDTTTTYDVMVVTATASNFWTQAQVLAQNGYLITAMGGNPADGVVLVGTKVNGDTLSRPFQYSTTAGTQGQVQGDTHSLVRLIYMPNETDSFNEQ